jgi:hypothetical protein
VGTTEGLTFRLYSSKLAKYYSDASNKFDAGVTYNAISTAASPLLEGSSTVRVFVKRIPDDPAAITVNTLQLMLKMADGGTVSRWVKAYHAELRGGRGASTTQPYLHIGASEGLVPTDAATVNVAADHVLLRDTTAGGIIYATAGTFHIRYSARYLGDVLVASIAAPGVGTNYHRVHWLRAIGTYGVVDGPFLHLYWEPTGFGVEGTILLDYRVSSTNYQISVATTSVMFTTEHSFLFTWSTSTLMLYVDGALAGSVALPGAIGAMKTLSFDSGNEAMDDYALTVDGHVRDIGSHPRTWTAAEVSAWHTGGIL